MQDEPLSLSRLLAHATRAHGGATVSTWHGNGFRSQSFASLGERSTRLAGALRALGVGSFDRVGTFMWNTGEHMEAYAAVPAMGAVLHPLNIRLAAEQQAFIANHAGDRVVLVDGNLLERFAEVLPELRTVHHVIVVGDVAGLEAPAGVAIHSYDDLLAAHDERLEFPVVDERSAAAMCYTSGTTGDPKGVVYSHRSLCLHAMYVTTPAAMGLSSLDRCLAIVPMFHVNAWSLPYAALLSGASLVLPDRFSQPSSLVAMMAMARPTCAAAVPTVWTQLLAHLDAHPQDISHLDCVVVGGAAVPRWLMQAFEQRHGVKIVQAWGMTETSSLGAVARAPAAASGDEAWAYRVTQGQFPPFVDHRLVDAAGAVVPDDGESVGELQVRGPWITGSYHAVTDTVHSYFDAGWLRTGDLGRVTPDGYLTLVDRVKDVIKSGGEWISSVEMENDLMAHPGVVEAAVFGVPDPRWDERPCAAVVLRSGETTDIATLKAHLAGRWASWQLPDHWFFVPEVPKTSVGKFDKKALRRRYETVARIGD